MSERLSVALADDEVEIIRQAAAANGLTMSNYIRLSTLGTASVPSPQRERILSAGAAAVP